MVVDEDEGAVDGDALGGVGGAGVGEFDVLGDVVGVEAGGAVVAGDGDAAVGVDVGDGPPVAVGDEHALVGALAQVLAGGDVVAGAGLVAVGEGDGVAAVDEAGVAEPGLDVAGDSSGGVVGGARDEERVAGDPLLGGVLGGLGERAGPDPAVISSSRRGRSGRRDGAAGWRPVPRGR